MMKNFYIQKEDKFCVIEKNSITLSMLSVGRYLKEHEGIIFSDAFNESYARIEQQGEWKKQDYKSFSLKMLGFRALSVMPEKFNSEYTLGDIQANYQKLKQLEKDYKLIISEILLHKKIIATIRAKSFKHYFDYEKALNDFLMESKRKQLPLTQTEFNKSLIIDIVPFASWKKNKIEVARANWGSILNHEAKPIHVVYEGETSSKIKVQNQAKPIEKTYDKKSLLQDVSLEELSLMAQKIMSLSKDQVLHQKLHELILEKSQSKVYSIN